MENKADKFQRIAEKRVNGLLDQLRLIGNLADQKNYKYQDEQIQKIFKTIRSEVRKTESKFNSTGDLPKFKL